MPSHAGPNTAGESNIVFSYDTGDTSNSYRGEPTTNLYTTLGFSFYQAEGGHTAIRTLGPAPLLTLQNNYDYHTITTDANWVSESKRLIIWPNNSLAASTSHYVSFWARVTNASTAQIGSAFYGSSINNTLNLTTEWQYFKFASTTHPNFRALEFGSKSGAIIFQIAGLQIELKSHATPYINGTRSATQGLLPIVGNSTIDLSNVSFDSNAQKIFDGTDDYIESTTNLTPLQDLTSGTAELIFKWNGSTSFTVLLHLFAGSSYYGTTIGLGNWTGAYDNESIIFMVSNASGTDLTSQTYYRNGTFTYRDGLYHHLVVTTNGSIVQMYLDGNQLSLTSTASSKFSPPTITKLQLGKRDFNSGTGFHSGEIPIAKIYNTALSADQVKQNYQQYKTRFNLS